MNLKIPANEKYLLKLGVDRDVNNVLDFLQRLNKHANTLNDKKLAKKMLYNMIEIKKELRKLLK